MDKRKSMNRNVEIVMKSKILAMCKSFLWCFIILLFPIISGVLAVILSLDTVETLFLQGTFMLISLIPPTVFVMCGKWRWNDIGFSQFDFGSFKKRLFFIPVLLIFIPVAMKGIHIKSAGYVLGSLFLYLFVGISEEVYFRGIIPQFLKKEFSIKGTVLLSTFIFGIGHIATAFTGSNVFEIALTVLNAFIFGWLAIEMTILSNNIIPAILLHFFFDFETKIVVMNGRELMIAESIRGVLMFMMAIWLANALKIGEDKNETGKKSEKNIVIHILEYLLLAFGIPLLCVLLCRINENQVINFILYGIEGASPAIAVIIVVLAHDRKIGLKKYMYDKYISNLNLKKCILGFSVPFFLLTCAKIVAVIWGDVYIFPSPITIRKMVIILWALVAEELGWRGYLQEKLEKIFPDKYIALITGIIWALWHYHFILSGSMDVPVVAFALGCVFESYGYFTITKLAKNNIVPASIWHFTGNMMFNLYRFDPQWHNGNHTFYWIATIFYAINILLFVMHEKKEFNEDK